MTTPNEARPLELKVTNFGPIAKAEIKLRPMTVFVGPSNTGKSYLATLIYALHRFFGFYSGSLLNQIPLSQLSFRWSPPVRLYPIVDLSGKDVERLFAWIKAERPRMQAAGGPDGAHFESDMPEEISHLVRRSLVEVGSLDNVLNDEVLRCFGVDKAESLVLHSSGHVAGCSIRGETASVSDDRDLFRHEIDVTKIGTEIKAIVSDLMPVRIAQALRTSRSALSSGEAPHESEQNARIYLAEIVNVVLSHYVGTLMRPAHYLPATRAGVINTHQPLVRSLIASATRPPTHDEASQPVLSGVYGDFLERLVGLGGSLTQIESPDISVSERLEQDILCGAIRIESNPVGYPSFFYRPNGWQRDLPLMNASSMVSELAPVVLYLRHIVQPGDTLIIEEPETNLHPQAQVEVTRVLAAAVKAGIRVVITTHSEWVLEELANLVRMSELSPERREGLAAAEFALTPDEIGAWFFDPNGENGGSVVREIPLDVDSGTFPSGFGLVTADLYNRWVEITSRVENG